MTFWREAGLTYLQYSKIASRLLREAIKKDKRSDFTLREASFIKRIEKKEQIA